MFQLFTWVSSLSFFNLSVIYAPLQFGEGRGGANDFGPEEVKEPLSFCVIALYGYSLLFGWPQWLLLLRRFYNQHVME